MFLFAHISTAKDPAKRLAVRENDLWRSVDSCREQAEAQKECAKRKGIFYEKKRLDPAAGSSVCGFFDELWKEYRTR